MKLGKSYEIGKAAKAITMNHNNYIGFALKESNGLLLAKV